MIFELWREIFNWVSLIFFYFLYFLKSRKDMYTSGSQLGHRSFLIGHRIAGGWGNKTMLYAYNNKMQPISYTHQTLYYWVHLFNCLVTQIANQPITWQQLNAFRHLDVKRRLAEVQTEHQNGEERGFKWLWTWSGYWCQKCWSEYFKNCWSTGIFTHNHF